MHRDIRLGYLASGSGSSVEELHKKIADGRLPGFQSAAILCNKRQAGIYERAERLGIPASHAPRVGRQLELLAAHEVDLVLGLGYIKRVEGPLLAAYQDRVINIHPTLLPKHGGKGMYGLATHLAILDAGDTHTGPTVHLMNANYDEGRILRQVAIPIPKDLIGNPTEENAKALQKIVLAEEYQIMAEVLERIRDGRLEIGPINC